MIIPLWAIGWASPDLVQRHLTVREVPVRVTWSEPVAAPMPVVVHAHGLGGSRDGYNPLVEAWSSAGYLIIQPEHPDSRRQRDPNDGARAGIGRGPRLRARGPAVDAWDERPLQVRAILDALPDLPSAVGLDAAQVDLTAIGVSGHSFGAQTALWLSGIPAADAAGARDLGDPRVDAVLALSPQGLGGPLTAENVARCTVPLLFVTGTDDVSPVTGLGAEWRLTTWRALPSGPRWLLWLDGAHHDLGGITGRQPPNPELFDPLVRTSLAFWSRWLRQDGTSGPLTSLPEGGPAKLTER